MELQDFHKEFLEDIKSTAALMGEGSSATFTNIVADYLIGAEILPEFIPSFYVGTGKNNRKYRVDGYGFDEFDYTMNLIISDYIGSDDNRILTKTEAVQIFYRLQYFLSEALHGRLYKEIEISTPCSDLVELLRTNKERIRKYRFLLLTDGYMSGRIDTLPVTNFESIPVDNQIWDVERLYKICFSEMGREHIEIDFKDYTKEGVPCLEANDAITNEYRSFLCVIPGEVLADIYDCYGSQLLEGNVRSFLSTKVAVNKKIRETILKEPSMFFAYNNGIAATAMDLVIDTTSDGKFITYAKDFQIINGGQTTASLSNTRYKDKADLKNIYVQMKLTEIDSDNEKSEELIRNISRSSNSQNKVSDADFFSTHPFHIRMEQISRRIFAPAVGGAQYETHWFYERARGQYLQAQMRMTRSQKNQFVVQNPKKQLITKTDFAKVRNSWYCKPHIVSKGAQTNFINFAELIDNEWSKSDTIFNESYFQESVALVILFKHIENLVSHQPWYENGYRANIVTYSLALLNYLIRKNYPNKELNLQIIWNKQSVPEIISNQLVKITKAVFESITDPTRETINVTQWCKRESCWLRIKSLNISLVAGFERVLVNKAELEEEKKEAKKEQKFINEIDAQTKVIEYGADNWKKVMNFSKIKKIVTPDELIALKIASQIPIKLPNTYQSKRLLEVMERAYYEGFKL